MRKLCLSFLAALLFLAPAQLVTPQPLLFGFLAPNQAIDPDAADFFSRTTLTASEEAAVNTLVVSLKAAGIWDEYDIIYPMVGASSADHAENLTSSSYDITWGADQVHDSDGVGNNDNGTTAADRGQIQTYTAADYAGATVLGSVQAYITVLGTDATTLGYFGTGYGSGTDWLGLGRETSGANESGMTGYGSGGAVQVTRDEEIGFYALTTDTSTDHELTHNGSVIASSTTDNAPADETSTRSWFVCAKYNGFPAFDGRLGFIGIAPRMTQAQVATAYTIIEAYQTALGRGSSVYSGPTFVDATSDGGTWAASHTVDAPSSSENDIIILTMYSESAQTITSWPSGFTQWDIIKHSTANVWAKVAWKRATASEPATYTINWSESDWTFVTCSTYSGCTTSGDPADFVLSATDAASTTSYPSISDTATVGNTLVVWHGLQNRTPTASTPPTGYTERLDAYANNPDQGVPLATKQLVSSGSETATGASYSGDVADNTMSLLINLKP